MSLSVSTAGSGGGGEPGSWGDHVGLVGGKSLRRQDVVVGPVDLDWSDSFWSFMGYCELAIMGDL